MSAPTPIHLTINGQVHALDCEPDMPLLWALRDILDLSGTKYGCGAGQCGACTVHIDGMAVRACTIRIDDVAGAVTTIEGVEADGDPVAARVIHSWIEHQVAQCGYCQPGQIMTAIALLGATPHPTDAEIDAAMIGNLCRCATYYRIRQAIHAAAT